MKKEDLKKRVTEAGDAIITYRSSNSKRQKYNVCTCDFSTPYIQKKALKVSEDDRTVLMFCWDTDSYRLMKPDSVISVVPLGTVLRNGK